MKLYAIIHVTYSDATKDSFVISRVHDELYENKELAESECEDMNDDFDRIAFQIEAFVVPVNLDLSRLAKEYAVAD